jgi:hypothetical protein
MNAAYFKIHELVDRNTFYKWGEGAWGLINPVALTALEGVREFFNVPVIVNNWWDGAGKMQFRGYRPPECKIGAPASEHRKGNAFDCTVTGQTAEEARKIILENKDNPLLLNITRMEADVSWLHFDCKPVKERIYVFKG